MIKSHLKKLAALCLTSVMGMSLLAGCGKKEEENKIKEMRDLTGTQLVQEMKIGWNLGNTLDATGGTKDDPLSAETSWGNPKTTEDMIKAVKEKGFNVIRVPVTWTGHLGDAPDYKINEEWLNRVQEVVNYVINNDLYCIINLHHEDWHFPSYDNLEPAKAELVAIWKQIAARFEGYDEHLIFEGMNEPRLKGTPMEWNGGNQEAREVINQLNAAFVETVRASGGNNEKRHLMIPTYAASTMDSVLNDFVIPNDDKVIVSVHAYLPYTFALADNASGTSDWSADNFADTKDIDSLIANLKERYIDNGQAVIIGEYGTRNRNFNTEPRAECARYYVSKATEAGIPCIWWDNNAFTGNGENFGLFNRTSFEWRFPEIVSAIMESCGASGSTSEASAESSAE